jgi:DNA-binding NarL/FixJ family response regulator
MLMSYPHPIEVLLVEDHHDVRRLLREIIETYKDLSIVGEAVNGEEAVLLAAKLKPAAVVMDIHLPVLSGVAAATLIKIHNPFVSIIALTAGDPNEDEKSMVMADVFSVTADTIQSHLEKLRPVVRDLALRDDIVSRWVYEIEEKQSASRYTMSNYSAMVESWVFDEKLGFVE